MLCRKGGMKLERNKREKRGRLSKIVRAANMKDRLLLDCSTEMGSLRSNQVEKPKVPSRAGIPYPPALDGTFKSRQSYFIILHLLIDIYYWSSNIIIY